MCTKDDQTAGCSESGNNSSLNECTAENIGAASMKRKAASDIDMESTDTISKKVSILICEYQYHETKNAYALM